MAEEKRTTVIDFQVHEGEALSSLASTKKAILDTKQAQAELNKAYKDGSVSLDHYAKESVQLEASLKKQQASYTTLQRTVTGLKSPFDKLNESIKDQAKNVTVAGVSLSTFANPATATIAVLGGLFKAYASSAAGAKDLSFASNQLSVITQSLANNLASLISSAEDGEGFFTKLLNQYLRTIGAGALASYSKQQAMVLEELEDLARKRIAIQAENNARLSENIEINEKLADSQVSLNEKQELMVKATTNIALNREALLKIAQRELEILNQQLPVTKDKEKLEGAIKQKELEISEILKDADRSTSKIDKTKSNILDTTRKQISLEIENAGKAKEKQLEADRKYENEIIKLQLDHDIREAESRKAELDADAAHKEQMLAGMRAWVKKNKELIEENKKNNAKTQSDITRITLLEQRARLSDAIAAFSALAGLFAQNTVAYKLATLTKLTLDTASAISSLTAASEANPANAVTFGGAGALQYALGLIRIFSNIAQATQLVSQAAGGGQFYTKGPQLLLVGDNPGGVERIDVTPVSGRGKTVVGKNMVAMAGGGSMMTDAAIMANSKNIPQHQQSVTVVMDYSEYKEFKRGVQFKEQVATA